MPRWVTVFGRVNHLGAEPGTQAYSAWACPGKARGVNRLIAWYTNPYPWSRSVRWMPGCQLACGDQRRLRRSSSALEVLRDDALYKSTYFTFPFTLHIMRCRHKIQMIYHSRHCWWRQQSHVTEIEIRAVTATMMWDAAGDAGDSATSASSSWCASRSCRVHSSRDTSACAAPSRGVPSRSI